MKNERTGVIAKTDGRQEGRRKVNLLHALVGVGVDLEGIFVACLVFRGRRLYNVRLQLFPRYVLTVAVFMLDAVLAIDRIESLQDALKCSVAREKLPDERSKLGLLVAA